MNVVTVLHSEQECQIDFFRIGDLVFVSQSTGTSLYIADNVLDVRETVKSIKLEYNWGDGYIHIYFGRINLFRERANFKTGVIASSKFKIEQFSKAQHQDLIYFFNNTSYIKSGTASSYTKRAGEFHELMVDKVQHVW